MEPLDLRKVPQIPFPRKEFTVKIQSNSTKDDYKKYYHFLFE